MLDYAVTYAIRVERFAPHVNLENIHRHTRQEEATRLRTHAPSSHNEERTENGLVITSAGLAKWITNEAAVDHIFRDILFSDAMGITPTIGIEEWLTSELADSDEALDTDTPTFLELPEWLHRELQVCEKNTDNSLVRNRRHSKFLPSFLEDW